MVNALHLQEVLMCQWVDLLVVLKLMQVKKPFLNVSLIPVLLV